MPLFGQSRRDSVTGCEDRRIARRCAEPRGVENAAARCPRAGEACRLDPGEDAVRQSQVADRAREGADDFVIEQQLRQSLVARNGPDPGLESEQPRVSGRTPQRAAAVRADGERDVSGGDRGDRAAARTARRETGIVGIARDAERRVGGVALERKLRTIGLAENDGAGLSQSLDRQFVAFRDLMIKPAAECGGHSANDQIVLDDDRHAVERALRLASPPPLGARSRLLSRRWRKSDHSVQARIERADAIESTPPPPRPASWLRKRTPRRDRSRRGAKASPAWRHSPSRYVPPAIVTTNARSPIYIKNPRMVGRGAGDEFLFHGRSRERLQLKRG